MAYPTREVQHMARLQILELPEGTDDSRPPFVLVVDQCVPQRVVLGMEGAPMRDYWQEIADRIGARGVIVVPDTVEIPTNAQPLAEPFSLVGDVERMDAITDALGLDRLRDWDAIVTAIKMQREGGHRFGVPGYLDPQRCAQCGIDRTSWEFRRDVRSCARVQADSESGHDFRPLDPGGGLACLRCGMPRVEWVARRDTPTCAEARAVRGEG